MSSNPIGEQYDLALKTPRAGEALEAEVICRRVLPKSRQDPNIICLLGEICLGQRCPQEARNWFRKVLKRHEKFPRALEGMGLALLADGKPKKASEILSKAVAGASARGNCCRVQVQSADVEKSRILEVASGRNNC